MQEFEGKQVAVPSAAALASSIVVDEQNRRDRDAQVDDFGDDQAVPQESMKLRDGGSFSIF